MKKYRKIMNAVFLAVLFFGIFGFAESSEAAANHYVRAGATGNGTDWTNALPQLPASLTRGDTYYIADGTYPSYAFNAPVSGSLYITIKKATVADHGTSAGWVDSYGDGQAILGSSMLFYTSYWIINGNGTHTVPSNNTNDYGFKVSSNCSDCTIGIVRVGVTSGVSNITIKYVHVYNTTNGSINNGTDGVALYGVQACTYIKLQNCFLENSGMDGLGISGGSFLLFERNYFKRLGKRNAETPDYHGQTVQAFIYNQNMIFRWNVFDSCEGQALIAYGASYPAGNTISNLRFYGNVVFNPYNTVQTAGFGLSGGIVGNSWGSGDVTPILSGIYIYNNTIVNIRASYTTNGNTAANYPVATGGTKSNIYNYNNMHYNTEAGGTGWATGKGYHASGGYQAAGDGNEQTGVSSSIFSNYTGNDFRLASGTTAGLNLSSQSWWSGGTDEFFGTLDSSLDMYGNTRGADGKWDRGAFEFNSTFGMVRPAAPSNLSIN